MITIIVPVYNSRYKINNLINSLINQSDKKFEVIFIDDNSKDDSITHINNKLSKSNVTYSILENDNNLGPGPTRNKGLKYASNKHITFVDSDDYIDLDFVKILNFEIQKSDFDILFFDYYRKNKKSVIKFSSVSKGAMYNNKNHYRLNSNLSTCCKLYRKDFLVKNNLLFPSFLRGEDTVFALNAINRANKIMHIDKPLYTYDITDDSITMSPGTELNNYQLEKRFMEIEKIDDEKVTNILFYRMILLPLVNRMILEKSTTKDIRRKVQYYLSKYDIKLSFKNIRIKKEHKIIFKLIKNKMIYIYTLYFKIKEMLKKII